MSAPRIGVIALLVSLALLALLARAAAQTTTPGGAPPGQTAQDLALPGTVTEETPTKASAGGDASGSGQAGTGGETGTGGSQTGTTGDGTATTGGGTGTPETQTGTAGDAASTGDTFTATPPAPPLDRPATKDQTGGVAGSQPEAQRRSEYVRSCAGKVKTLWPISQLGAIAGSNVTDRQDRWPWYVLALAGVIVVLASAVWAGRRHQARRHNEQPPAVGLLGGTAALVGLLVALPGLVGLIFPGVGTQHHPPAQATMVVREVQARITRGEFIRHAVARAERPTLKHDFDLLEVGHVVWLELDLSGFRGDDLKLTWASYSRPGGYSLIPKTDDDMDVTVGKHSDAETRFVPIWVGLPKYEFQVRFRLIDARRQLRQVARTGDMRGSRLRYACV